MFLTVEGMSSLPQGLASKLKGGSVKLNQTVVSISQKRPNRVQVSTKDGKTYEAKKVILSLPTPMYKDITFEPELPADKLELVNSTKLGYYAKVIVIYNKPWWKESGYCGLSQSFVGPASLTRDSSNPEEGQHSLTCFIVGDPGRKWSKLSPTDRKASILSQLGTIFGPKHSVEASKPIEFFEQDWSKEEFSKGCPCPVMIPKTLSRLSDTLQRPFGGIHFVGTESADKWKGYMEGALESGARGANEVVETLRGQAVPLKAKL